MNNKVWALEFLHAIRNRLYYGVITKDLHGKGAANAGDYSRTESGAYAHSHGGEKGSNAGAYWSLKGAFLRERDLLEKVPHQLLDDLEAVFEQDEYCGIFTSEHHIPNCTAERIFGLLEAVTKTVEDTW